VGSPPLDGVPHNLQEMTNQQVNERIVFYETTMPPGNQNPSIVPVYSVPLGSSSLFVDGPNARAASRVDHPTDEAAMVSRTVTVVDDGS
ncbi:unnamed protein product, partial [Rotaria sp. Silwood1]